MIRKACILLIKPLKPNLYVFFVFVKYFFFKLTSAVKRKKHIQQNKKTKTSPKCK